MKAIFIAGTDTRAGKTVVTGLLSKYLQSKGCSVITQKWINTGKKEHAHDSCVYQLKFAASPHLSARLEKKKIEKEKIKKNFKEAARISDFAIIEGTGGALVPFNKNELMID
ncbi:MAG: dethiobiotin synthase, partial [Candidatus Omnitrophica bacterium]|nr:dethiobiotin synthase [Candidatus Omnitrophota bacterium]